MSGQLQFRNRQRSRKLNLRLFAKALYTALRDLLFVEDFEIVFFIVGEREMTRLNEKFLQHAGSTDVITFDYSARNETKKGSKRQSASFHSMSPHLHGEIFVCIHEAIAQAKRFRTVWEAELVRYAVHGVLHLLGYDDTTKEARRRMKREEDRVVKELALQFNLKALNKTQRPSTQC